MMDFTGKTRLAAYREAKELLLKRGIEEAEREAKLAIAGAIRAEISDVFLYGDRALAGAEQRRLEKTLERRLAGMPLQYAMHTAYFMGLKFYVDRHVLIPRPETELLVEFALRALKPGMHALDLCTGSGCIAVSLARYGEAAVTASDKYRQVLAVAERNARDNGVQDRIEFIKSDMFDAIDGSFDLVVTNPPYIPDAEWASLEKNVRDYEPAHALKAGDGLKYYRIIANGAKSRLVPGGALMAEIGYGQKDAVSALFREAGYRDIRCEKDYSGIDRIIAARV
jgi:release factor glutamine methyltransferase